DLAEAEDLSDEVVVIDRGRIIAQGAPEELRHASADSRSLSLRLARPAAAQRLSRLNDLAPSPVPGTHIAIEIAPWSAQIAAAGPAVSEAGLEITEMDMHAQSLAEVFFDLTGRPLR